MANKALALADAALEVPAHINLDQGLGNENVGAEIQIPRIKMMQKMSSEIDPDSPTYVDGAKNGNFVNDATGEVYGDEMYVLNVNFTACYKIWKDRQKGGGFFGEFATEAEARQRIADLVHEGQGAEEDFNPEYTHVHLLIVKDPKTGELSAPAITDLTRSKMRASKAWNTEIQMKGGDRFACLWKMISFKETYEGNTFANLKVENVGWAQKDDYDYAMEVFKAHQK